MMSALYFLERERVNFLVTDENMGLCLYISLQETTLINIGPFSKVGKIWSQKLFGKLFYVIKGNRRLNKNPQESLSKRFMLHNSPLL